MEEKYIFAIFEDQKPAGNQIPEFLSLHFRKSLRVIRCGREADSLWKTVPIITISETVTQPLGKKDNLKKEKEGKKGPVAPPPLQLLIGVTQVSARYLTPQSAACTLM